MTSPTSLLDYLRKFGCEMFGFISNQAYMQTWCFGGVMTPPYGWRCHNRSLVKLAE